jgi:hypothetical protein
MQVNVAWSDPDGAAANRVGHTLLVSRNGGVIRLDEKIYPGQEVTLQRALEGDQTKSVRARIMAEIDREPEGFIYAVAILDPRVDFWEIEFPSPQRA